jgi:predicted alpha/beta superfamily hydrolase
MSARRKLLVLALLASPAGAQTPASPWTRDSLQSAKLGEQRILFVATPAGYATSKDRYPVLVLLDADDEPQFNAAVANVAFLTSRGAIPPLIVVGVANGKDRSHDMTPPASGATMKQFATAGGAGTFESFIHDEVLPRVRTNYRTLPTTILAGHSFGGLFALYVAATNPGAYTGIVAMSPSLWWNDSTVANTYADAIAKAAAPTRVFATSGGLEPSIDVTTRRFEARLDSIKPASLAFGVRHYPEDTHGLTPEPSLIDGLRFVFAPISMAQSPLNTLGPSSDSAGVVKAVTETEAMYARGARSLGLPEHLPEAQVNNLGYAVLQVLKLPNVAAWVFRRNVTNYPDSPNVYDSLGDALLAASDSSGARVQFRMARDVALRTGQKVADATQKKLEALEQPHTTQAGKAKP